jgi:hypothetical protein
MRIIDDRKDRHCGKTAQLHSNISSIRLAPALTCQPSHPNARSDNPSKSRTAPDAPVEWIKIDALRNFCSADFNLWNRDFTVRRMKGAVRGCSLISWTVQLTHSVCLGWPGVGTLQKASTASPRAQSPRQHLADVSLTFSIRQLDIREVSPPQDWRQKAKNADVL